MTNRLNAFFSSEGFMPHGMCYLWQPPILALHIASDLLIALAYFSIPVALLYFVKKRRDLHFHWMYVCFAVFIVACGATHLMEIWVIWRPFYWLSGAIKAVTAIASVPTAILLTRLVPRALLIPSPEILRNAYAELEREVAIRRIKEGELRVAYETLRREAARGRLAAIVESSNDAIMSENRDGTISTWNQGAERMFGYSALEAIGQPSAMLTPMERADEKSLIWGRIENDELISSFETVRLAKDGRRVPVFDTISPIRDIGATIVGASEIARDISEWKRSQELLTEQENILDLAPVIVCDLQGTITRWSHGAEMLYGFTRRTALGSSSQALLRTVHPVPSSEILDTLGNTGVWKGELTRRTLGGSQIHVASICVLHRDEQGNPSRILESNIDLTEHKRSEHELAVQVARLGLLSKITAAIGDRQDLPSISRYVIQALEDQLPADFTCLCLYEDPDSLVIAGTGIESAVLGMDPILVQGERISLGESGLSECLQGQLIYTSELSASRASFQQRLASAGLCALVAVPLVVNNSLFGVLLVARLTKGFSSDEREFLQQLSAHIALAAHQADLYLALEIAYHDLRETQKTVLRQEKLRVLGQMASGIAHDINNALAPAVLYVESLLEINLGGAESKEYLLIIQRAIEGVAHTVARMKQVYGHKDPSLLHARFNLNTTIEHVIDLTHYRWSTEPRTSGMIIRLITELDPQLPQIVGDESDIRDALTNLLLNAVDAMPAGGELTLKTSVVASDKVQVEVRDTGIGMDEATRIRCQEMFFTTKGALGTGLGLSTVHGSVERHGGEIQIESTLGVGTTVRVILPIRESAAVSARTTAPVARTRRTLRILVIDDDLAILKSLRLSLERDGHTVATSTGGQAGIDTFRESKKRDHPFEVVITDHGMPHVDGIAVAAAVKSMQPDTLVILLTGQALELVAGTESLAPGDSLPNIDRILSKPARLSSIRNLLLELTE